MIVCVNDCGFFYDDRIIDLLYVVVVKLGYYSKGIVWVKFEVIYFDE